MDPRRDIRALLQPDPLGPFHRQLPDPRADDEEQGTRHGAGCEEAAARTASAEKDQSAADQQRDAEPWHRAAGAQGAAGGKYRDEPGDEQC